MAATGYTPISLYYSSAAGHEPVVGNLVSGELAINITDGKLFYKDNSNNIKYFSSSAVGSYPGAGIAVSTGSAWTTSYSSSNPVPINTGGTNNTAFTGLSGNVAGLVFFDGTKLANDTSVTDVGYETTTNTVNVKNLKINAGYTETVYTLGTSGSIALSPANGTIQTCASSGTVTFTDSVSAGQSIVLMITGGNTNTINWPTTTWVSSSGNAAPTLTASSVVVFWKVSTTLYGSYVGSYA